MPGPFLKFDLQVACSQFRQVHERRSRCQRRSMRPAPPHGSVKDGPTGNDNARKAAEAKVDSYGAAMKNCDNLKDAEKSVCAAQAEAVRAKGMADINTPARTTPKRRSTRRTK